MLTLQPCLRSLPLPLSASQGSARLTPLSRRAVRLPAAGLLSTAAAALSYSPVPADHREQTPGCPPPSTAVSPSSFLPLLFAARPCLPGEHLSLYSPGCGDRRVYRANLIRSPECHELAALGSQSSERCRGGALASGRPAGSRHPTRPAQPPSPILTTAHQPTRQRYHLKFPALSALHPTNQPSPTLVARPRCAPSATTRSRVRSRPRCAPARPRPPAHLAASLSS